MNDEIRFQMNDEIRFQILLNADIHDIINLCEIDKSFNKICHDKHFWVEKYNIDDLQFIKSGIDAYLNAKIDKLIFNTKKKDNEINLPPKIIYSKINDLWFVRIQNKIPKIIDEREVIQYLKKAIINGDVF